MGTHHLQSHETKASCGLVLFCSLKAATSHHNITPISLHKFIRSIPTSYETAIGMLEAVLYVK